MNDNRNKSILIFEILSILLFILNIFFLKINNYYVITLAILLLIVILVRFLKVGFEKRNFRYLKDVLLSVTNFSIIYMLTYYISGLLFGFLKTGYSLRFDVLLKNIIPVIVIIIASEFLRYIINNKIKDNIILFILSILLFIVIDINLNLYLYDFDKTISYIYVFVNCILPSVFKNILLTYISHKVGYKPNIIYRIITELPKFLVPIIPDMPSYIFILFNILFNWLLCMHLVKIYTKQKLESPRQKKMYIIPFSIMSIIMICIIYLCSGFFRYSMIAIGSGSMEKELYKGDAIILKKVDPASLKLGDILVFDKENKNVVHRIVEIKEENDFFSIKTKGDNNEKIDDWTVTNDEVIGVVKLKIKYIGYPTVWISELIK